MRSESPDPAILKLPPRSIRSLFHGLISHHPSLLLLDCTSPSHACCVTPHKTCCGHHARYPLENVSSRTSNPVVPKRTCIKISVAHPVDSPASDSGYIGTLTPRLTADHQWCRRGGVHQPCSGHCCYWAGPGGGSGGYSR